MDKAQIMQQIAALDKQILTVSASNRVPSLNSRNQAFPLSSWIAAAVLVAVWQFGGMAHDFFKQQMVAMAAMGLAGLFALFALYRTFAWLIKGGQKKDKKYVAAMEQVAALQQQRDALQKALKSAS